MSEKILLILFVSFFPAKEIYSQSWQWSAGAGGVFSDKATDIDIDSSGNLYVSGYYNVGQPASVPAYFGNLTAPLGSWGKEGFIAKIDSSGNWLWVKAAIGGWDERVLGICTDKVNGFVYATGTTWNDVNSFDNCSALGGSADEIFVGKFDLNGNCQWLIHAGSDGDDHGYDMVTDKLGNIYLTGFIGDHYGWFGNPGTFGNINVPMPPGADSSSFIAKISPDGTFLWVKTFEAIDGERDNGIAIDSSANIFITGGFWGTKQFGSQTFVSNGGRDIFVLKFDSTGNQLWAETAGSSLDDRGNALTVDKFQDIYVTGEFRDKVGFGTDTIKNNGGPNGRDIFVSKLNQNGNWIWAKKAGSNKGEERGDRIISNRLGNIFLTGQCFGNTTFGPDITLPPDSTDSLQVFVASLDTAGKWQWALRCGGNFEDRGTGITGDDSCNLYIAGYYKTNSIIGHDTLSSAGGKDIFTAKIVNACFNLPVPTAAFSASTYEICQGECIDFSDTSIGNIIQRSWLFQGGNPSTSILQNQTVCYNNAGMFNVQLSVSNMYGSDTAASIVIVHPLPETNAGEDTCIAAGTSLTLTATGGENYFWSTGDSTATITINPIANSIINVIASIGNCKWGDGLIVNVFYPPKITGSEVICEGDSTVLTSSPGENFLWSTGENTSFIEPHPKTDSLFQVTITDACTTMVASFLVKVVSLPQVFACKDTLISLGTNGFLSATGGGTYLWNTGETAASIIVNPEVNSIYSVTATIENGCAGSDSVLVLVDAFHVAMVPSVFSPNGDGKNDVLFVRGDGIKEILFSIYNRWGEKVFETKDLNSGWDGNFKEKSAESSVFVYTAKGKYTNGDEFKLKGNVTLVR